MNFNFMTQIRNKIQRLFDKKTDLDLKDVKTDDTFVDNGDDHHLSDEFKDCDNSEDNAIDGSDSSNDNQYFVATDDNEDNGLIDSHTVDSSCHDLTHRSTEEVVVECEDKSQTKVITDWYELQTMGTPSKSATSSPVITAAKPPKPWNKSKEVNRLLEKWGESVGIFDEWSGAQTRLIRLKQLQNYFVVKLSSLNSSDCLLLCSLINNRYPRFYTSTVNYYQRWRMRYNLFVVSDTLMNTGRLPEKPLSSGDSVTDVDGDQLALHMGEMHLYFDIVPKYCQPVYVNSSFYANKGAINKVPGIVFDHSVMARITRTVNSIRYSKDIFQFKFPLSEDLFHRRTPMFDKFFERQMEFIDESVKVFRKNEQKKRKYHNWNHKQQKHTERTETRDYFAYDYDIKHKVCDLNHHFASASISTSNASNVNTSGHHNYRNSAAFGTKPKASFKSSECWNRSGDDRHNCNTPLNDHY